MHDFDLSGQTSFKEEVLARLPIDFSAAASPHTLLIQQASEDPEFAGNGEADLPDIGQAVRHDRLQHAMNAASGVLVDGLMAALGGPAIKSLVGQRHIQDQAIHRVEIDQRSGQEATQGHSGRRS